MAEQIPTFNGCSAGKYCSDQAMTPVGENKTPIYHRTVTTLTGQGPAYTGSKTETYIIKPAGPLGTFPTWTLAATTIDGGKTQTYTDAAGEDFKKSMGPGGNIAKNTQAQVQTTLSKGLGTNASGQTGAVLDKINPEQQKKLNIIKPSVASQTGPGAGTTTPPSDAATNAAIALENEYKKGTRTKYDDDMRYPLNLSLVQDVIKFSILKYSPSLAKENQNQGTGQFGSTKSRVVTLEKGGNPIIVGSERIGVITLPIPSGISDNNPVGWEKDDINMLQSELSKMALGFFNEGIAGAEKAGSQSAEQLKAANASGEGSELVKKFFLDGSVQNASASKRAFGSVFNNNAELLFSGPSLRQFPFTFLFYPRSEPEAIMVRKIIRAFKQSMAVKRSATSLLLKAPHTFAIQYMTVGKKGEAIQHPYLNRFKECALTSCSVDYTPENTYMTYNGNEKSMTAYRLSLSFSELEPIFDDEYPEDNDASIGF